MFALKLGMRIGELFHSRLPKRQKSRRHILHSLLTSREIPIRLLCLIFFLSLVALLVCTYRMHMQDACFYYYLMIEIVRC